MKRSGVVIQGLPSGIRIDEAWMGKQMEKRKPKGKISTQRQEADVPEIVSGVFEGRTTGHTAVHSYPQRKYAKQGLFENKIYSAPFACRLHSGD